MSCRHRFIFVWILSATCLPDSLSAVVAMPPLHQLLSPDNQLIPATIGMETRIKLITLIWFYKIWFWWRAAGIWTAVWLSGAYIFVTFVSPIERQFAANSRPCVMMDDASATWVSSAAIWKPNKDHYEWKWLIAIGWQWWWCWWHTWINLKLSWSNVNTINKNIKLEIGLSLSEWYWLWDNRNWNCLPHGYFSVVHSVPAMKYTGRNWVCGLRSILVKFTFTTCLIFYRT